MEFLHDIDKVYKFKCYITLCESMYVWICAERGEGECSACAYAYECRT